MNDSCIGLESASKELAQVFVLIEVVNVDLVEVAAEHPRVEVVARFAAPCWQVD